MAVFRSYAELVGHEAAVLWVSGGEVLGGLDCDKFRRLDQAILKIAATSVPATDLEP